MAESRSRDSQVSRRQFLSQSLVASVGSSVLARSVLAANAERDWPPAIVVFTKVYQVLGLSFDQSAAITAEAGLAGVDVPVRPKGEVEPERVEEDLPRYAE